MDYDTLLSGCCEVARELLRHGAEIQRAEDTMRRLLAAYGLPLLGFTMNIAGPVKRSG